VLKALLYFFHLVLVCSESTIRTVIQKIALAKVIRAATSILSVENPRISLSTTSQSIILYKHLSFTLLVVISDIMKNKKAHGVEDIFYKSILTVNMMGKLLRIACNYQRDKKERALSSRLVCQFLRIFSLSCMVTSETLTSKTLSPTLALIFSSMYNAGIITQPNTLTRHLIPGCASFFACICHLIRITTRAEEARKSKGGNNIISINESSTSKKRQRSKRNYIRQTTNNFGNCRQNLTSLFGGDILQIILKPHIIIPLSWGLAHSNKEIDSALQVIFGTILERHTDIQVRHIWECMKYGYIQTLIGIRYKCRVCGSKKAVDLIEIMINLYLKKIHGHLNNSVKNELYLNISSHYPTDDVADTKAFICCDLFLLYTELIRMKRNPTSDDSFYFSKFSEVDQWRETILTMIRGNDEDSFITTHRLMKLFYIITKRSRANLKNLPISSKPFTKCVLDKIDLQKKITIRVECGDKIACFCMQCPIMEKILIGAPVLAEQIITNIKKSPKYAKNSDLYPMAYLKVPSYDVIEAFMCHVESGLDTVDRFSIANNLNMLLDLVKLACTLGSSDLIKIYLDMCKNLMNSSNSTKVLKLALDIQHAETIEKVVQIILQDYEGFKKSLDFEYKIEVFQKALRTIFFALY